MSSNRGLLDIYARYSRDDDSQPIRIVGGKPPKQRYAKNRADMLEQKRLAKESIRRGKYLRGEPIFDADLEISEEDSDDEPSYEPSHKAPGRGILKKNKTDDMFKFIVEKMLGQHPKKKKVEREEEEDVEEDEVEEKEEAKNEKKTTRVNVGDKWWLLV